MNKPAQMSMEPSSNQRKHESRNPIQRALIHRFHQQAISMVRRANPASILEVGCGEGYVLEAMIQAGIGAELHAVELSERAVTLARERIGTRALIEQLDARDLAASSRRFDMVMILEVLEHIPEPQTMLGILERLTYRWLLASVPREPYFCALNLLRGKNLARLGNDPEHVNLWRQDQFKRFINLRFDIVATPNVFPWTMLLAERRDFPAAS